MYGYIKSITLSAAMIIATSRGFAIASTLEQLAASNDSQAQYQLGLAYETGQGVNKDLVQATKWYRVASNNGHQAAQFNYAQALELGLGIKANPSKAALIYTQLASSGEFAAYAKLGHLYSQFTIEIPSEDQAVLWYSLASKKDAQYQKLYEQALQRQYHALQRRKIDALEQQEIQNELIATTPTTPHLPSNKAQSGDFFSWLIAIYTALLICLCLIVVVRDSHRRKLHQTSESSAQQLKSQIDQQQIKIKQLSKHLKLLTERYHHAVTEQPQSPDARLQLAYARFGFDIRNKERISTSVIKQRYKKLSRIYHPDAQGSEDEMKQLNVALDTIIKALKSQRS